MANVGDAPPEVAARGEQKRNVVFMVTRETRCSECGQDLGRGNLLRLEGDKALCIACADLDHLEFLPRGDAALTRRATDHSRLHAVVVKWSSARKRYERQGILVEPEAVRRAEEECIEDASERARRREIAAQQRDVEAAEHVAAFARAIREQFPSCPEGEALEIARHACRKHSGRVGRSALAKQLDPEAVRLAVAAHVRHAHTDYDLLLLEHGDRTLARDEVTHEVTRILEEWRRLPSSGIR